MNIQRLRNLTTGRLHTKMEHIYEDLEYITGEGGIMTHMIPRVYECIKPWLEDKVRDKSFWDGEYNPDISGEFSLEQMNDEEKERFWSLYNKPLRGIL